MFTYCIQKDTIRVEPRDFAKEPCEAIKEEIHRRYANKVIPGVGLCISLLDILSCTEGAVLYGDGCFYYQTEFRLIVFRPFVGEMIVGKVKSQSPEGIVVTLGFFDDILVPPNLLPDQCAFDQNKREFFWLPTDPEEDPSIPAPPRLTTAQLLSRPDEEKLFVSKREWIRIRVEEEKWDDSTPSSSTNGIVAGGGVGVKPGGGDTAVGGDGHGGSGGVNGTGEGHHSGKSPYSLICSMGEEGLGALEWWLESPEEEMAED